MNTKLANSSENISIIGPANSSSTSKKIDLSTIDDLITQCETLLKNNFSKYDICIKYQEKLRLQLIKANKDYKCLRAWLEIANEDCFKMISNDGHLAQIYESLLRNNILKDFVEHEVAREKLNLEFLSTMMQVKDLKKSLSSVDGDMTLIKSDYEELQYREVLMQINSTEESHEYLEFGKNLRLKLVSVLHECERLSTSLKEACEEIGNLKSKHDDLTRCYNVLLQNTSVEEFLNYTKYQEKLPSESPEKLDLEQRRPKPTEKEHCLSNGFYSLRSNEYQEKLVAEQRRREQIEKEYSSLDEFSDKLCHLLLKYQRLMLNGNRTGKFTKNNDLIQNSSGKRNSVPCNANVPEEFPSFSVLEICALEMKEENNEELGLDKDELHLDARSNPASSDSNAIDEFSSCNISKMSAPEVDEENNEEMDSHENGFHFLISSFEKDNYLPVNEKKENYDTNRILSSSNQADLRQAPISTSTNRKRNRTANGLSYCKKCDKFFALKKNKFKQKCPTCNVRNKTIVTKKKNRPTSSLTKSSSVVANSSVTDYLCSICNRYYSTKANLYTHQRHVHEGLREFECTICGKMLSTKQSLIEHVARHSSLKPYKCSICNQCFSHPVIMKRHVRISHNKKKLDPYKQPYKSSECGKAVEKRGSQQFQKKKCRKKGQRSTNDAQQMSKRASNNQKFAVEKPESRKIENSSKVHVTDFRCHLCGRYYAHSTGLHLHKLMVHERYRPFKCKSCSRRFTRIYELRRHELTHTSLRPHKCSLCPEAYRDRSTLKKHLQNFHNDSN